MKEAAELVVHSGNWSEMIRRLRAMLLLPNSSSVLTATERQFNVSGREDCINSYIVQQFIENCNCLPSILPVKVDLFDQYSYCFDAKDIGNLSIDLETRYNEQVSRINQYEFEAMKRCQSPCRTDGYSVRPLPSKKELESLQNRLARLTVQAWTSSSQEITEEEAYPTKNLVADI
uniref:Dimer_Tnp_hAT domain-containing protein n=1 Tax=Macrostomum lignano TaxID=282301 RepID=A0A1I8HLI4_9PLAT